MTNLNTLDVVTIGEAMALLVAETPGPLAGVDRFVRSCAGAELNVAVGLSRLGWRVGYVSRVGADPFGEYLLATLDAEGIDRRHVQVQAQYSTGFMLKSRELAGADPQIAYFRKGSAASHMGPEDLPEATLSAARYLHITGISMALSDSMLELVRAMVLRARAAGVQVSLDPNLRARLWASPQVMTDCINRMAALAHIVMPGLQEGQLLTGRATPEEIAAYYLDAGADQVVVKLGPRGAYAATQSARTWVPGFQVGQVVDTVGAGDGFAVGVLSGLMDGLPLVEAVVRGNAIGARVVQFVGDSEGLPTPEALAVALQAPRWSEAELRDSL
ncbi:MAG: sugar kinase [Rhodoferax sp.]|nr:sugar kinase [Rhodoferax sp.]